ncbi:MAG: hypothetical protein RMY34_25300 [Aulosira sp. DedQUE10]|nr:hypothetical protein [Aulosira sp. DedQUE10]
MTRYRFANATAMLTAVHKGGIATRVAALTVHGGGSPTYVHLTADCKLVRYR